MRLLPVIQLFIKQYCIYLKKTAYGCQKKALSFWVKGGQLLGKRRAAFWETMLSFLRKGAFVWKKDLN
ncbi:MAG: hypothetical protein CVT94_18090 [Bacteroidetes bacterium HGW-Bacteroidetes-11]|jgi:hypothetical protein|nr:MAG: hypothetical protein CVT94_18090 [Bacteroidetes bacterium HGW-Bacteroidetes-11]